ncbi:PAP/fibrillin family protein [Calothrix sp. PCC 6303]|uniref:PAP/fibrillin family protein n=1 Tax=Calothrix sp. PCC 6303 TaxID=1170562 RepID=UPI0002A015E6|nr:PAP/fibrillin family protein [Calothrix sp. PCC 6303]AFY99641.1 PAP fibrillin family protein [Calothrix sp. PCC 6303]
MNNRTILKKQLQALLGKIQTSNDGSPITNLQINQALAQEVEKLTEELEGANPNLYPLLYAPSLLQGNWLLKYSTAREIRSLASLPLGLKVGKIYQAIDLANKSFFNLAFVKHPLRIISGYVKVTANFEIAKEDSQPLPDKRINVYFDKRYLSIEKIIGIDTPQLNPFKVVKANNPQGRIPTLDITYLDEDLRIGRGGDGSLFILTKSDDLINLF